jgi:hypothetical protein
VIDSCRAVPLSGALVASMADLVRGFDLMYHSKYGSVERGGGDLWILHTRRFFGLYQAADDGGG